MILEIIGLLVQSSLFHEGMNQYTMCSTFMTYELVDVALDASAGSGVSTFEN